VVIWYSNNIKQIWCPVPQQHRAIYGVWAKEDYYISNNAGTRQTTLKPLWIVMNKQFRLTGCCNSVSVYTLICILSHGWDQLGLALLQWPLGLSLLRSAPHVFIPGPRLENQWLPRAHCFPGRRKKLQTANINYFCPHPIGPNKWQDLIQVFGYRKHSLPQEKIGNVRKGRKNHR
jgi:hypothetical protein